MINFFKKLIDLSVNRFLIYKIFFGKNHIMNFNPVEFMNLKKSNAENYRFTTLDSIKNQKIDKILDFGANYGFDTNVFKSLFPNSKISLYDIDENVMFYLGKINRIFFDNSLDLVDKKKFNFLTKEENCYDLIYSNAVLMYLNKKEVKRILKKFIFMSKKYIVLHELDNSKNLKKDLDVIYYLHDFTKILYSINPKIKIHKKKTLKPGKPWNQYGSVITISNFK